MKLALLVRAVLLGLAVPSVSAQSVYRCGPDGRSYSQTPCDGGRAVKAADPRSQEQQDAAHDRMRQTQAVGDQMAQERRANEGAVQPAPARSLTARPATAQTDVLEKNSSKGRKKSTKPGAREEFTAIAPGKNPGR